MTPSPTFQTPLRLPIATRRSALALSSLFVAACASDVQVRPTAPGTSNASDEAMSQKFRGLQGGQLQVDSLFQVVGLNIFDEQGSLFFSAARMTPPRGGFTGSYGAEFGVPRYLRVEWRDRYATAADPPTPAPPNHPDGPLIGWDLERGLPLAADGSKYHFAGGDFQEAFIYNGKPLRKGWFIHPRTGQRVETDF